MNVALFESIGGAASGSFALSVGTLVVDANGVAAFTPA